MSVLQIRFFFFFLPNSLEKAEGMENTTLYFEAMKLMADRFAGMLHTLQMKLDFLRDWSFRHLTLITFRNDYFPLDHQWTFFFFKG